MGMESHNPKTPKEGLGALVVSGSVVMKDSVEPPRVELPLFDGEDPTN